MRLRRVLVIGLAVLAAGCSSSHTGFATVVDGSGGLVPGPALTPVIATADVVMCRQLEAYPPFKTIPAAKRYARWLLRQSAMPLIPSRLSHAMTREGTDLLAYLSGPTTQRQVTTLDADEPQAVWSFVTRAGMDLQAYLSGPTTQRQVRRDAAALQAVCASYGVTG
jgi:hypothetical protein